MQVADLLIGEPVRVHVNLTLGNFVICDPKTKRMITRVGDVTLRDVTFRVSEKQRQWVINNKMRQVHAWAFGILVEADSSPDIEGLQEITYNPFRSGTFTLRDGETVSSAKLVIFKDRKGWTEDASL